MERPQEKQEIATGVPEVQEMGRGVSSTNPTTFARLGGTAPHQRRLPRERLSGERLSSNLEAGGAGIGRAGLGGLGMRDLVRYNLCKAK